VDSAELIQHTEPPAGVGTYRLLRRHLGACRPDRERDLGRWPSAPQPDAGVSSGLRCIATAIEPARVVLASGRVVPPAARR
jgi:hypothetical protein